MNLSAYPLATWQKCKRKAILERDYEVIRWHPKTLLESCFREGILKLSNGQDVIITSQQVVGRLMHEAAHSGMNAPDPYKLARDYCAILETTLEAASRLVLLKVSEGPTVELGDLEHCWKISAFIDESGMLHRWIMVDTWNEDALYENVHSWYTFGDCAANRTGMVLHVVEIGRQVKGHQHSDWCRSYKHPAIQNKYRFRKVDGSKLEQSWIPCWYQDSQRNEPKPWVDLMQEDKLTLFRHIEVKEPSDQHVAEFHREVEYEANLLTSAGSWQTLPRSRSACDVPYPCPWQSACFAPGPQVSIEDVGGYRKR